MPAFIPASLHFRNHAIFLASTRMVCNPSKSFSHLPVLLHEPCSNTGKK
ncbi:MAG: hypothetical protein WAL81_10345 [Methanobacterium sp.]